MMGVVTEAEYRMYRGKCKSFSTELASSDENLELTRGWYVCTYNNRKEEHWWCVNKTTGEIVDPTKDQFLSKGTGTYIKFNGFFNCEQCGKEVHEKDVHEYGRFHLCSQECIIRMVL